MNGSVRKLHVSCVFDIVLLALYIAQLAKCEIRLNNWGFAEHACGVRAVLKVLNAAPLWRWRQAAWQKNEKQVSQIVLKRNWGFHIFSYRFRVTVPALRFMSSVRFWEALRGLESLVRQTLIFSLSAVTFVSVSASVLYIWQADTKALFYPCSSSCGDTSLRWRGTQWLTYYCRRTEGATIHMIAPPEGETGLTGEG